MPRDDDTNRRSGLGVPKSGLFEEDELTPVQNWSEAMGRLVKMAKGIDTISEAVDNQAKHVRKIPGIKQDLASVKERVDGVRENVVVLGTKLDGVDKRVERIETKPHDCFQIAVLENLQEEAKVQRIDRDEGIKTRAMVRSQDKEIKGLGEKWSAFAKARRGFIVTAVLTLIGSIGMIAGAVAYATNLGANQRHETEMRRQQFQQLNKTLEKLSNRADSRGLRRDIYELKATVEKSNGYDEKLEQWWESLSPQKKRHIERVSGKRIRAVKAPDGIGRHSP